MNPQYSTVILIVCSTMQYYAALPGMIKVQLFPIQIGRNMVKQRKRLHAAACHSHMHASAGDGCWWLDDVGWCWMWLVVVGGSWVTCYVGCGWWLLDVVSGSCALRP